jgi:hypothetical protein
LNTVVDFIDGSHGNIGKHFYGIEMWNLTKKIINKKNYNNT